MYLAYYHYRLITKLALSKAHTFAKTADSAKLLLLNKLGKKRVAGYDSAPPRRNRNPA